MTVFLSSSLLSKMVVENKMARRQRSRKTRQPRQTILLVTNGRVTEYMYLKELGKRAQLSIKVKMINGEPETLVRELQNPRGDTSGYSEVWIVVDEDGMDRSGFLAACQEASSSKQPWYGIVSRPCFEVWLIAHYEQVHRYSSQQDAQRHFQRIANTATKELPQDFPYNEAVAAIERCHLPGIDENPVNELPPSPGTAMPHLVRRCNPDAR